MMIFSKKEKNTQEEEFSALLAQGLASFKKNEHQKALKYFQDALKIKPDSPTILSQLGYVYKALGEYDQAVLSFEQALKVGPKDEEEIKKCQILHHIALVYTAKRDWEKAKMYSLEAIKEDARYAPAYKLLAGIYFDQKEFRKSVEYCGKALEIDPNDTMVLKVKKSAETQI